MKQGRYAVAREGCQTIQKSVGGICIVVSGVVSYHLVKGQGINRLALAIERSTDCMLGTTDKPSHSDRRSVAWIGASV
jgi:hypothetical protein